MFSSKMFSISFYGKLGLEFVGKNDINLNIKTKDNKIRVIRSKKKEEVSKIDDLGQIYPL